MNAFPKNGLKAVLGLVLAIGISQPLYAVNLHDGLISYWQLNEGSGTTAGDTGPAGGVADAGTLRNSPTWISGIFGAGLQFNGVDQDVLIPNSTDMDVNTQGVTLSAWVKLDQLPSEIAGSFSGIFDSVPDSYVMYLDKSANELRFKATATGNGAERPGVPAKMLDTTAWHHVMGVFDGGTAGANKIYFDGQLVDIHSALPLQNQTVKAGQISGIGGQPAVDPPNVSGSFFQGGIADVALWNRPLGLAEAQYLYNNGTGNAVVAANPNIAPLPAISPVKPTAQPVIYYNFDNNLDNHGTGGASLNAVLNDAAGVNDTLYTPTAFGQGMDLRQNPISTASTTNTGDHLSVDYTLGDSGTIATRVAIDQLYNFQTLWSNSGNADDWEAWIYSDGRFAARGQDTRQEYNVFLFADPTASHHYAFTWERDGQQMQAKIYVDGVFQGNVVTPWVDPGTTLYVAGGGANHYGAGIYDEFRVYNSALSEAEILYLSQNAPETVALVGDFNLDGKVDAADYVVWRDSNGAVGSYGDWKANFGNPPGSGSAATIPEPSSVCLAFLSLIAASMWTRRRRSSLR